MTSVTAALAHVRARVAHMPASHSLHTPSSPCVHVSPRASFCGPQVKDKNNRRQRDDRIITLRKAIAATHDAQCAKRLLPTRRVKQVLVHTYTPARTHVAQCQPCQHLSPVCVHSRRLHPRSSWLTSRMLWTRSNSTVEQSVVHHRSTLSCLLQ